MAEPTLRRYVVRDHHDWAIIVIGSDGYFSTVGSYGNYAYGWWSFGPEDFRHFLAQVNCGYVCGKLARSDEYQSEETLKAVKETIAEFERDGQLDKATARKELARLDKEFDGLSHKENFHDWYRDSEVARVWSDAYELCRMDVPRQVVMFFERMFTKFQAMLRDELAAEAKLAEVANA